MSHFHLFLSLRQITLSFCLLSNLICFSQSENQSPLNIINNDTHGNNAVILKPGQEDLKSTAAGLSTRIMVPASDDPFYTSLGQGETKDYSILSGTTETPYSIVVDVLYDNDDIFEGVDVNVDNAYLIGNSGGVLLYDIYFDLTAVTGFPGGTYKVKIVTLFQNAGLEVIGGYERENIYLTIYGDSAIVSDVMIHKLLNAPVIDGIIDPVWSLIEPNPIEFEPDDNPLPVTIEDASWKMAFTDDAFYVLIKAEDNEFCDQWCTGFEDWQSDRAEVFFDIHTEYLKDGRGSNDSANNGPWFGHYRFTTQWIEGMENHIDTNALHLPADTKYEYGYLRNNDSWVYEMLIPFVSLTIDSLENARDTFIAEDSVLIGFGVRIIDTDNSDGLIGGEPVSKIMSWKDSDCRTSMDNAGIIGLSTVTIDDEFSSSESITNIIESNDIFIYPNPATDYISLGNRNKIADIRVYDMLGNLVLFKNSLNLNSRIDISRLTNGLYFLKTDNLVVVFAKQK